MILAVGLSFSNKVSSAARTAKSLEISPQNASLLKDLAHYPDLEILSINCLEDLRALPDSISKLTKLKELTIDNGNGCSMNPLLPESLGSLHLLEKLVLYGAQDNRAVGQEPPVQPKERHEFPESMSQLRNLSYLDLGRNGLTEIPAFVKNLSRLRELRFQSNKLKSIPPFIAGLRELRTLRLDENSLDDLPSFLNSLPKLTRVTLGNDCSITQNTAKRSALKNSFPKIALDFTDEYDCPTR